MGLEHMPERGGVSSGPVGGASAGAVRVARNSAFGVVARGVDLVMRFVVIALIARYLGTLVYGDFAVVAAAAMLIHVLVDFGVEPIMVREMSAHPEDRERILGAALCLRLGLAGVLLLGMLLLVVTLGMSAPLGTALMIESVAQALVAIQFAFIGVYRVFEKMEYDLVTCAVYQVLLCGLVGVVIFFDFGFVAVFVARVAAEGLKLGVQAVLVRRRFMPIRLRIDLKRWAFLIREAAPMALLSILTFASVRINIFFLKGWRPPQETSFFDIPQRITMAVNMIPLMIVMAVFPGLCRKAANMSSAFGYATRKTFKFLFLFSLPVSVLLIVLARDIICLLFGPDYAPSASVLQIIGVGLFAGFLIPLMNLALTSVGKQKQMLWGVCSGLVLNIALVFLLVPRFGHIGAAVAVAAGQVAYLVVNLGLVSRYAGGSPVSSELVRVLGSGVAMFVVCHWVGGGGLIRMALNAAAGGATFVVALFALRAFSADELRTFSAVLRKPRPE